MKQALLALALLGLLPGFAGAQGETHTFTVTATAAVTCGPAWPIYCHYNGIDQDGAAVTVDIHINPPAYAPSTVFLSVPGVDATVMSYTAYTPPGSYFPTRIAVTFQGGAYWDGEEYIPATGQAVETCSYKKNPGFRGAWIPTCTLQSLTYTD